MPVAYIALGSNLGDKEKNLEQALDRLRKHGVQVLAVSPWITTAPYGVTDQPDFLNGAAKVEWGGDAKSLLHTLLAWNRKWAGSAGGTGVSGTSTWTCCCSGTRSSTPTI